MQKLRSAIFVAAVLALVGQQAPAQTPATGTATTAANVEYRLGSGDGIHVNVFDEPDLTGDFNVSGDGKVSLPMIGDVQAAGLTATELQTAIENDYRNGYLKDPKVNIQVTTFRPFYILGEVGKPGEYPFSNGMTVVNAVALAEGFTYRANKKKVFIRHMGESTEEPVPLTSDLIVAPGDTIRIGERYF